MKIITMAILGAVIASVAWGRACYPFKAPPSAVYFENVAKVLEEVVEGTPNGGYVKVQYGDSGQVAYGEGQCNDFKTQAECTSCLRGLQGYLVRFCRYSEKGSDQRGSDCFLGFSDVL